MADTKDISPRVGFAYDLTGRQPHRGQGLYGQSRWNSADELADKENPVGIAQLRYAFVAVHADPARRGATSTATGCSTARPSSARSTPPSGGAGFVTRRPRSSTARSPTSCRPTSSASWSPACRRASPTCSRACATSGPKTTRPQRRVHRAVHDQRSWTGQHRRHRRRADVPDVRPSRPAWPRSASTPTPKATTPTSNTVEMALNRRMMGKWMMLTSAGYIWSKMAARPHRRHAGRPPAIRAATRSGRRTAVWRRVRPRDLHRVELQDHRPLRDALGHRHLGLVARAERPALRPHHRVHFPGDGARVFRVEPITANRYDTSRSSTCGSTSRSCCRARPAGSRSSSTASTW